MIDLSVFSFRPLVLLGLLACHSSWAVAEDLQSAINFYKDSHFLQAKPLFESALKDMVTKNTALYYLGRIAFDEGDVEKAKNYLNQSVELEPNSSDEYFWLGRAYGELAQGANILKQASYASSAHKYFQLAVDADSKNIDAHRGLLGFYIMAPSFMGGGIEKAEKTLADIRSISPMIADIKQLDLYGRKEEKDKQLSQARFLVTTYPKSAEALFQAAHVFRNQNKLESAITSFDIASKLPITPENRMFVELSIFQFGETCQWANVRLDEAIASVEKYISLKDHIKETDLNGARWTLAKLYYQEGNMEKYQLARKQIDAEYFKQNKWIKEDVERFDKNISGSKS